MATYSFTLTDVQDAALAAHVADLNVRRVAEGGPPFRNNGEYVEARVLELIAPVTRTFDDRQLAEIRTLFERATLATRAKVKSDLEAARRP